MAFNVAYEMDGGLATLTLSGELDRTTADEFRSAVETAAAENPQRLVLILDELDYMASAGLRILIFARQKMGSEVDIYVVGAHDAVLETIEMTGFHHSVIMLEAYDVDEIETF